MRIHPLALLLLPVGASAFLSSQAPSRDTQTALAVKQSMNVDFIKPVMAAFATMTLAGNVAFAEMPPMAQDAVPAIVQQRSVASSHMLMSASFDTMDFSLPSYEEGTKAPVKDFAPPSFANPFGDLKLPEPSSGVSQAEKDAAKQAKEDEKIAAKQAKEDEKAAAQAAKDEKAARRAAELQKQKDAVARAKVEKESAVAPAAPAEVSFPEMKIPDMPKFEAPDMPKFDMPKMDKVDMPKFDMPKFDVPKFEAPDMPKFDMPKMDKVDMPKFEAPKFDSPKFDMPKMDNMPSFSGTSSLKVPDVKMPDIKMPAMPSFGGGDGADSGPVLDEFGVPQEVRDERAKEARSIFIDADKEAKAIEAQARAVRNIANEKKKVAAELKDAACKTRWGGKILCLRPFNSGY